MKLHYFLLGLISLCLWSCGNEKANIENTAKIRVNKILKGAENKVKVFGQTSVPIDLEATDVDAKLIRALAQSCYDARASTLHSEECLRKKQNQEADASILENIKMDSIYNSLLTLEVKQIDSLSRVRNEDPTVLELMVEIEKLEMLKKELDQFCF